MRIAWKVIEETGSNEGKIKNKEKDCEKAKPEKGMAIGEGDGEKYSWGTRGCREWSLGRGRLVKV